MRRRPRLSGQRVVSGLGVFVLFALSLRPLDAQPPAAGGVVAGQNGIDLDQIVSRHLAATDEYEKTFRNLVAEETKTIDVYRGSGEVDKRRHIVSDLLVYQSTRNGASVTTEYRDVRSVDGKVVQKRAEKALELVVSASRKDSLEDELEAIDRQTHRYEFHRHLRGFAISQGGVLKRWRQAFTIELAGREQIDGRAVLVLDYRQAAPIPGFRLQVPKEFGRPAPAPLHRGRLWIDAQTFQLWRDVWELAWPHPGSVDPLGMLRRESAYRASPYGILVPDRIVWDWREHFTHPKNGRPSFGLSERTTFTYGSFKRFDVVTTGAVQIPK